MTALTRRRALLGALALPVTAATARADSWPSHPLRVIVPFAAGAGVLDIMARLVSAPLGERLGQQIVVDNKPGAGGNVGAAAAAQAAPDGYTLLVANTAMVVSPFLYAHPGFDPLTDFAPISMLNAAPLMLLVHPSLPVHSVTEFIAYAKANPGKLYYGSGGIGSTPFLAVELLKAQAGFDAVHVPYKGGAPALADLMAGQVQFMIENVPGTLPFVKDGKLRALAITSTTRSALVPDLPTMQEAGVKNYEMIGWNGLFAPKATPAEILARIGSELRTVLAGPEIKQQMAKLGADPGGDSPEHFAAFVKAESDRWGKIIRDKGIKPE
ncbi:Tripartite-type tricarboxylate transporter, receptor component TctC [Enhydrobacter aerosaccus]|uniref:Tripartite-type tricarboxylate transporter, receptor component TctC n=1 Tax=Enhydrobacter aerosaccus TaxID=225324 RepID=A0A1T4QDT2_9HYPH|nr:tripartite tricarboxylate transporter substrate binding protein [Enhydrobacter aerosaccus]SKA01408.1 Tripartite-type tricarboxylate transporter, receptor component TctC [Enhydrobacter aerosaccus]